MSDPETIKILLDSLTGTLSDLSSKFDRIIDSNIRIEQQGASLQDKTTTVVQRTQQIEEIRSLFFAANKQFEELQRMLIGAIGQLNTHGSDIRQCLRNTEEALKTLEGDGNLDLGIRANVREILEIIRSRNPDFIAIKQDLQEVKVATHDLPIGLQDVSTVKRAIGPFGKLMELIRKPLAIALILLGILGAIMGVWETLDFYKGKLNEKQKVEKQVSTPSNTTTNR